jgi:hypothetical protein
MREKYAEKNDCVASPCTHLGQAEEKDLAASARLRYGFRAGFFIRANCRSVGGSVIVYELLFATSSKENESVETARPSFGFGRNHLCGLWIH